jgi:hypothetical protein
VQAGDTVRLKVQFYDWNNDPADPDEVIVTIYDSNRNELIIQQLGPGNKESVGAYYYDYTLTNAGTYYYEFKGTLEGTPALRRGTLKVIW